MKPGRLRAVRWTEMSIVFQGALHALNPVQSRRRSDRGGDQAPSHVTRLREPYRHAARDRGDSREAGGRLSASALGRAAPACADRARARLQPADPDRRRADNGARRHGAGTGARAPRAPPARAGALDDLHHARPLDALVRVPAHGGHVRRSHRGGRGGGGRVRTARAPLHGRARRGIPADRRPHPPHEPLRARRRSARSARDPERVPVPSPLCGGHAGVSATSTSSSGPPATTDAPPASTSSTGRERERCAARDAGAPRPFRGSWRRACACRRRGRPRGASGRGARARRRVRLREDDTRAVDHGPRASGRR